jgi:thioesterase domain-containing protein/acyl carrier protein
VRGFRIELGEIEAALGSVAGVRECTVIVREDAPGDKRIVAYVVGRETPEPAELTRFLASKLPQYMVPAHFVALEALPLSPNGKVDRKRLPAPDWSSASEAAYEAPRNEVERRIAEIWSEVLGVERVGIHDDFFTVGGNSLLSTQAVSRIRKAFGVELPLRELFQEPTVAGLATRVGGAEGDEVSRRSYETSFDACLIPLQPRGWKPPLFLVSGAHADEDDFLRFVGSILPHLKRDQPIYGFKARGLDGVSEPHRCAEEMAADYIREMRAFRPSGPYLLAGNCVGGIVAYEMAQQLRRAGEEVSLVALLDTTCPLDDYEAFVDHHYKFWKLERFLGHWRKLGDMPLGARMSYVARMLGRKARRFLPMSAEQRRRNRIESVERQYSMILARYRPAPYAGKVTLIVNEELQKIVPDAGWRPYCSGGIETHVVSGDHVTRLSLNAGASAEILERCISTALEQPRTASASSMLGAAG